MMPSLTEMDRIARALRATREVRAIVDRQHDLSIRTQLLRIADAKIADLEDALDQDFGRISA